MRKIEEARTILKELQVPAKQQSDLCCYVLLAMAGIGRRDQWESATNEWIRIHDIIAYTKQIYGVTYSPNYRYRLTDEMLSLLKSFGTAAWTGCLTSFQQNHESLIQLYASKRAMLKTPVRINGVDFTFSPGKHNELQKAIIEEFAPRFAPNCECLYVGDTTEKDLVKNVDKLSGLGFEITLHDKMPDVVLYSEEKNWLYFIESVTSVGPMEPKRIKEIEEMTVGVKAGKIYVTAFLDFKTFKKFSESLAWETEVWIADMPDHMIHLNGDKFLGPR